MKRALVVFLLAALPVFAADVPGYLYAPDGEPIEGARVTAFVPIERTQLATAVTAKDGGFVLSGVPEGIIEVEVDATKDRTTVLAWTADGTLTLHQQSAYPESMVARARPVPAGTGPEPPPPPRQGAGIVTGVVRVNGKPLANAPIVVQGLTNGRVVPPLRLITNAKGEFRATGLDPLRYVIVLDDRLAQRFRVPNGGMMYVEGREPFSVDLRETREGAVNVDLVAAPTIRGRVIDAEGKPVARARVQLMMANRPSLDFAIDPAARTTPDGRYSFAAPEWSPSEQVSVAVTAPLHATVRSKPFVVGDTGREVDITLPKFETVRLRVLDRAGKPVPNARVAFASSAETTSLETIDVLLSAAFVSRAVRANAEGEVALQLTADTYDFAAVAEGFQTGSVIAKTIARPAIVDVTLVAAATIRGRVHRNKAGIADVHINVMGGNRARRDMYASTAADGTFEIGGIAPGTYRLSLFKPDELVERTMTVEAPGVVDIELPPAGTLRGRVVDAATGVPVPEFAFSVEPVNPEPGARHQGGVHRGEQSPDGTFTVSVPVGAYRVSAGAPGFTAAEVAEVRVTDTEPALVELRLGRGVTITGRVTDESGTPLADADVMVMGPEHGPARSRRMARVGPGHAKTNADGTFRITGVEQGEANVHVRMTGFVTFRKAIQAEGTMDVDVRLARGLSLRGVVTRNGKPLPGAQVSASTPAIGGEHQPAITDADGRFTLMGLVAARYTVSAYFEEQHASVNNVDPAKQKELAISLDPKPRGVIYGTVSGMPANAGKVVRRAVSVESEHGSAEGMIDEVGNYRIENAPVGVVYVAADVEAAPRGARSIVRKQVEVVAGQPLRVDFELTGNVRVSGRVTHEGKALSGVQVGFSSHEEAMVTAVTREDGTYEAALPVAGRYTVYARAEQLFDRHYQSVREIRGGERIDIDLREQVLEGTVIDAVTRQPIANAIVTLTPAGSGMPSSLAEMPTDANGRFRVTAASTGAHRLIATATGYAQRAIPTSANATQYSFELAPVADLRVRVVDVSSRAPLDAHLIVTEMDGSYVPTRPRRTSDGTTYVFSLAPGKYRINAVVQGYTSRIVEVTAPGTADVVME